MVTVSGIHLNNIGVLRQIAYQKETFPRATFRATRRSDVGRCESFWPGEYVERKVAQSDFVNEPSSTMTTVG